MATKYQAAFRDSSGRLHSVRRTYGIGWSRDEAHGAFLCLVRERMDKVGAVSCRVERDRRHPAAQLADGRDGVGYTLHPTLRTLASLRTLGSL